MRRSGGASRHAISKGPPGVKSVAFNLPEHRRNRLLEQTTACIEQNESASQRIVPARRQQALLLTLREGDFAASRKTDLHDS